MKKFIAILFVGLLSSQALASDKLIVRFKPGNDLSKFKFMGQNKLEALIPELGIYAVEMPARAGISNEDAAAQLRNRKDVVFAQEDHPVTMRQTPNDKSFSQLWGMKLDSANWGIDALTAWGGLGQGGMDAAGNEIVVAVVDGGVDVTHSDLANNIWVNKGEIPNNKKDDDGNGFVDDVHGWNAYNSSGDVESDYHGTHVAGIVGAAGNNGIGVVGVNWNVKIMVINGSTSSTSTVLKAYGYVLKQKQLWLKTGGKQGANIVATNSSFGVDYGDCSSSTYAAWNNIYNEMGQAGILHAIATANLGIDIDKEGDVPTGCSSDYIIAVTNTQRDGSKNSGAGWGTKSIDLGAPGTNIYSTIENDSYGNLTGTSMATPHVAGAVAYMHSAASTSFSSYYLQNPSAGALALKDMMLQTVTPAKALAGKTVSGGILNVNKAAQAISAY